MVIGRILFNMGAKLPQAEDHQANRGQGPLRSQASSNGARVRTKNKCLGEGLFLTVNSNTINEEDRFESTIDRQINARATSYEKGKKKVLSSKKGLKLRKRYEITKKVRSYEKGTKRIRSYEKCTKLRKSYEVTNIVRSYEKGTKRLRDSNATYWDNLL